MTRSWRRHGRAKKGLLPAGSPRPAGDPRRLRLARGTAEGESCDRQALPPVELAGARRSTRRPDADPQQDARNLGLAQRRGSVRQGAPRGALEGHLNGVPNGRIRKDSTKVYGSRCKEDADGPRIDAILNRCELQLFAKQL